MHEEPLVPAAALDAVVLGVIFVGLAGLAVQGIVAGIRATARAAVRFHRAGMARLERYDLAETVRRHPSASWRRPVARS